MADIQQANNPKNGARVCIAMHWAIIIILGALVTSLYLRQNQMRESLEVYQIKVHRVFLVDSEGNTVGHIMGGEPVSQFSQFRPPEIQLRCPYPNDPNRAPHEARIGFCIDGPTMEFRSGGSSGDSKRVVTTVGANQTDFGVHGFSVRAIGSYSPTAPQGIMLYWSDERGPFLNQYFSRLPQIDEAPERKPTN